jgi:hypothetical protein
MSFRINFLPYDHEFLLGIVGTGDASYLVEIDKVIETVARPPLPEWWRQALAIAKHVVNTGLPSNGDFREDDHHSRAAYLLVDPIAKHHEYPYGEFYPDTEFRYLDFLANFPAGFFDPIQNVETVLTNGTPWFGNACPDEITYGTIFRTDVDIFAEQCLSFRDTYDEPKWEIDPIIQLFDYTRKNKLDLWFKAG